MTKLSKEPEFENLKAFVLKKELIPFLEADALIEFRNLMKYVKNSYSREEVLAIVAKFAFFVNTELFDCSPYRTLDERIEDIKDLVDFDVKNKTKKEYFPNEDKLVCPICGWDELYDKADLEIHLESHED